MIVRHCVLVRASRSRFVVYTDTTSSTHGWKVLRTMGAAVEVDPGQHSRSKHPKSHRSTMRLQPNEAEKAA